MLIDKEKITKYFEELFKIKIRKPELYLEALTHSSFLNENKKWEFSHNERLEFLGDAVLQLCVSDYIYSKFPDRVEGELTPLRANLVNSLMLSKVALSLELEKYLFVSKGEKLNLEQFLSQINDKNADIKYYVLADATEAIIGAIYLDQGFMVTKNVVIDILNKFIEDVLSKFSQKDHKSLLQEKIQELFKKAPSYKVISQHGPAHKIHYVIGVYIHDKKLGEGEGWSKKDAEESAAENALKEENWKKK